MASFLAIMTDAFIEACKEAAQPFVDSYFTKTFLAVLGLSAGFLFGVDFYQYIWIIVVLVAIDSITGVWGAREAGETISSRRFILSVPKLIRYLIFIAAGHLLQSLIGINLYIENAVLIYLATTEFISIAENLGKAGMPVPKRLLQRIEDLRNKQ